MNLRLPQENFQLEVLWTGEDLEVNEVLCIQDSEEAPIQINDGPSLEIRIFVEQVIQGRREVVGPPKRSWSGAFWNRLKDFARHISFCHSSIEVAQTERVSCYLETA